MKARMRLHRNPKHRQWCSARPSVKQGCSGGMPGLREALLECGTPRASTVNIGKADADHAPFAPSHLALTDRPGPLLPQQDQGRQGNRHEHAQKGTVLRNIPDRAFHEAGLIDKEQPAAFSHLVSWEGSSIVVQGLALRCLVLDDGSQTAYLRPWTS